MFFVSAAERSAAAGILQEMKRQESGGDPKKLRPRRRRHLTKFHRCARHTYGIKIVVSPHGRLLVLSNWRCEPVKVTITGTALAKPLEVALEYGLFQTLEPPR